MQVHLQLVLGEILFWKSRMDREHTRLEIRYLRIDRNKIKKRREKLRWAYYLRVLNCRWLSGFLISSFMTPLLANVLA